MRSQSFLLSDYSCYEIIISFSDTYCSSRDEEEAKRTTEKKQGQGIAIILNTNARGVTPEVVEHVQRIIQEQQQDHQQATHNYSRNARVYVTSTQEEARQAARELVEMPPALVVPVGGNGTLTTLIQCLWDNMGITDDFPLFGYIPRGTGNALGSVVGCKPRKRQQQQQRQRHKRKSLVVIWESIRRVLRLLIAMLISNKQDQQ
jgi:hypothetical protein